MAFRDWIEKNIAGGEHAPAVIRLTSDGSTWQTWTAPFPEPETLLAEAEEIKSAIADECPIRRIPLMFTAESSSGGTLAQYPCAIQGRNKSADALAGSGNNAAKAFSEAMEGISRVMVAILKSAETQIKSLTGTLESQATQIHDLIEYHRVKQEVDLLEAKDESGAKAFVGEQIKEILPLLPEALKMWLADHEPTTNIPTTNEVKEPTK